MTDIVGFIASIVAIVMFLPQVIKTVRMKETRDLSIYFPILAIFSCFLWFTYGVLQGSLPLIITNGFIGLQAGILLVYKLKYH